MMRRSRNMCWVNGPGSRLANDDAVNAARNSRNDVRAVTRIAARLPSTTSGCRVNAASATAIRTTAMVTKRRQPCRKEVLEAAMIKPRIRQG